MKWGVLAVLAISTAAFAQDYKCAAKVNANRGFPKDFAVLVAPAQLGGEIRLIQDGGSTLLAKVAQAGQLHRDSVDERDAFNLTLGLISEADVSGVSESDLDSITEIDAYSGQNALGAEIFVYQIFNGTRQIGGSFLFDGMGTACLP